MGQSFTITSSLISKDENPLFEFDSQDEIKRNEVLKTMITAGIFTTVITGLDIRGLNMIRAVRKYR